MPRIPQRQAGPRRQAAPMDPTIRADGSGLEAEALAQVTGDVANFAADLMKKRKRANDTNFAKVAYLQDLEEINKFETQLKQEEGENPVNYSDRMSKFLEQRNKQRMKDAPNEDAFKLYQDRAQPLFTKTRINADNYQNITKAEFFYNSERQAAENAANGLLDNPSAVQAAELIELDKQDYERNVDLYGEKVANKLLKDNQNMYAGSVLSGLERQERFAEGMSLLLNNEQEGKITSELSTDDKARWMKRFKSGLESQRRENINNLTRSVNDLYKSAGIGQMDANAALETKAVLEATDFEDKDRKKRLLDKLTVAEKLNGNLNEMYKTPRSELVSAEQVVPDRGGNFNATQRIPARNLYRNAQQQMLELREEDGAGYVAQVFPEFEELDITDLETFTEKMMFKQRDLGISNVRPLPKSIIQSYATQIESQTAGKANEVIDLVVNRGGKNSGAIMSQLVMDGKINSQYAILPGIPNPETRKLMVENIKNVKDYEEVIKTSQTLQQENRSIDTELASNEVYMNFVSGFNRDVDPTRTAFVRGISQQIVSDAKRQVSMGTPANEAIENSMNRIFNANFILTDTEVPTVIPRYVPDGNGAFAPVREKIVKNFVDGHLNAEYFKKLDLKPGSQFRNKFPNLSPSEQDERFREQLVDNSFFDLSSDQRSLILKTRTSASGSIVAVRDNNNQPIKFDLIDLQTDQDEFTIDAGKGVLTRIGDFFSAGEAVADE